MKLLEQLLKNAGFTKADYTLVPNDGIIRWPQKQDKKRPKPRPPKR